MNDTNPANHRIASDSDLRLWDEIMFFKFPLVILCCPIFFSVASPAFSQPDNDLPWASLLPRAAILVEASEEASHIRTYTGHAAWSAEPAAKGGNQSAVSAIGVDIDIPKGGFKIHVTMEKNDNKALSFSHFIKIAFTTSRDNVTGLPVQIGVPQLRDTNSETGTPLSGAVTQIKEGLFLIALKDQRPGFNAELLKARDWFDIPMKFSNGKIGKLTFEQGPQGHRLVAGTIEPKQKPLKPSKNPQQKMLDI